jgi:TolB-like protein/Tfp pilus assembly protein PilF
MTRRPQPMQPGARVGPYEVIARIGSGGMGEVYRARDTRLGRDVAIKVLPADFAADDERVKRFEREARATAALAHPNVAAIFDVGTHDGAPYLVEELVEGESLRVRLVDGPLPVRQALEIAVQIAHGLTAAHGKGIIHRDLKPENVMITPDGTVKILDFGLAKFAAATPSGDAETITQAPATGTAPGRVLGSTAYMAPEQARGFAVDERADIFAFGVVLHEMLAGERPFRGQTSPDTMAAILKEAPRPLPDGVPAAVRRIVSECLEKRPEQRFSSAHDLLLALQAVTGGTEVPGAGLPRLPSGVRRVVGLTLAGVALLAAVGVLIVTPRAAGPKSVGAAPKKIVVLPFENLGSPEDAYFASGMTDEITSRLANVPGLGVISRTSAAQYEHARKSVKQIGAELDVDYVLEGSVRWEHGQGHESRVRITPQLIRVADDTHVWADRYDRVLADVFAIQSEVAGSTVKAMGVALLPHERAKLKEISTDDLEAYDLYLRGLEAQRSGQARRDIEGALQCYQASVDRDPRFAQALAGLAEMHLEMYWLYYDRRPARAVKAREAAERAVELRPDLAETHVALGFYFYEGLLEYPRALDEFTAALKIQPKSSVAHEFTALVLRRQGRWAQAVEEMNRALELDPKNGRLLGHLASTCLLARRYADADHAFRLAIGLSPLEATLRAPAAWLQVQWCGDAGKAQAILDEAERVAGLQDDMGWLGIATLQVAMARRDYEGALRLLEAQALPAFDEHFRYWPISLLLGEVEMVAGRSEPARRAFEVARIELQEKVKQDPEDARYRGSLGIAYAGLGMREVAIREAQLGCDLMPPSKDAYRALFRLEDLAVVYTMTGRADEAIATLGELLSRSGRMTSHVLRLDAMWDPLRSDPRFRALLTKYEVKE